MKTELVHASNLAANAKYRLRKALKSGTATLQQVKSLEALYDKHRTTYDSLKKQNSDLINL